MIKQFEQGHLLSDTAVTPDPARPGSFVGHIPNAWKIVYAFGGVTMAVALRALRASLPDDSLQPLYASALFVSPVPCGDVSVDVEPHRCVGGVFYASARLRAHGAKAPNLVLQASFGRYTDGRPELSGTAFPEGILRPGDSIPKGDSVMDNFPNTQQFELRWAHDFATRPGAPPREPTTREPAVVSSWIRYLRSPRLEDGTFDAITYPVPADQMGPAIFRGLGPGAELFMPVTLAMDIHFFGTTRHDWLLQHSRVWRLSGGYACGVLELWDEDGALLALSTQRRFCKPFPRRPSEGG